MTPFLQSLTMTYLLWPLLGLLLVFLGVFIAKKNAMLSNKRLIGYFIGAVIVLTVPALLGFLNYDFMPYGYIALAMMYLILGSYNTRLVAWVFNNEYKYRHELTLTMFLQVIAMLFFVLVFNLCNELRYGLWASTCMLSFLFVCFFVRSYNLYLNIPDAIYKVWKFSDSQNIDMYANVDFGRLKVVRLEIYKEDGDTEPLLLKGKVPDQIEFGVWVKQLIEDYNKNSPLSPIKHTSIGDSDSWIFYRHNSILLPKRYIDCAATVKENRIGENCLIVAKRVKEYIID